MGHTHFYEIIFLLLLCSNLSGTKKMTLIPDFSREGKKRASFCLHSLNQNFSRKIQQLRLRTFMNRQGVWERKGDTFLKFVYIFT